MSDKLIQQDNIGDFVKYTCKLTESYLIFMKYNNYILLDESVLNWDNPKTIIYLLNYAFTNLINTCENKYKYFRYYVSNTETDIIDMTKWDLIEMDEEKTLLECEISKALNNILETLIKE